MLDAVPSEDVLPAKPKPRGRRPASVMRAVSRTSTSAPDWLFHYLTINGPAEAVDAFAGAARGAGVTPWQMDFAALEEDIFVRAVAQPANRRNLTVQGCRILARQFRDRAETHHALAVARVGHSRACPFDLHALLPVPAAILQAGPTHPVALIWLQTHWGLSDRPRQVAMREKVTTGRRLPQNHAVIGYSFFTRSETPQAAIATLATRWPALRLSLQPRPAD